MMQLLFSISLSSGVDYYLIFYLSSFIASFSISSYCILKSKKNLPLLYTLLAAISLFFVFGCKILPVVETQLLGGAEHSGHIYNAQIALGGIILCFMLIVLLMRFLKIPEFFLKASGLGLLVGLGIQKFGCLLTGCCKGIEMTGQLGLAYGDGLLRHPLPLYEVAFYSVAIWIFFKLKSRKDSSKIFLAAILFCVIQFFSEFMRDPNDTLVFAQKIVGIKIVQWIYVLFGLLVLFFYFKNESIKIANSKSYSNNYVLTNVIILLVVVSLFFLIHPFLFQLEIYAINIALIPALLLTMVQLFNHFTLPQYRWASLSFLILPVILMSQTFPADTKTQQVYKTIGVGYHGGRFDNYIVNSTNPGSCSGNSYGTDFQQKYSIITIGYSSTKIREKSSFSYGINASAGILEEKNLTTNEVSDNVIGSVNPYFTADLKWLGVGFGLHLGNNFYALTEASKQGYGYPSTGLGKSIILPQAHFRVGPKRFLAIEYDYANHFPYALPAFTHEFAIGSGFSASNGLFFKYGVLFGSQSDYEVGRYISGYIPIENKIVIEPLIGLGSMSNVYMLGVSYRLGHKETFYPRTE